MRGHITHQGLMTITSLQVLWSGSHTLAAQPWSQVAMVDVVICAIPIAIASPFVVIMTTCCQPQQPPLRPSSLNNYLKNSCIASRNTKPCRPS